MKRQKYTYNLSLDDATREIIEIQLKEQLHDIIQNLKSLDDRKKSIEDALLQFKYRSKKFAHSEIDVEKTKYDKDWKWGIKINYILQQANRCMTVGAMVDAILALEPERQNMEREVTRKLISNTVMNHKKYNTLIMYKEYGKTIYGLPEWFDDEGNPLEEYKWRITIKLKRINKGLNAP